VPPATSRPERNRNDDVSHLDRRNGDAPGIRSLIDELLEFGFNLLAAAKKIGQVRSSDDVAQRRLRGPAHRLRILLHLERRLLRVVNHPEQHGVHVDRHRVRRQRLLGGEAGRDGSLIDPRRDGVDKGHNPEQAGAAEADEFPKAQDDRALPLLRHARRLHQHNADNRKGDDRDRVARDGCGGAADGQEGDQNQDRHDVGTRWVGAVLSATRGDQGHGHAPF
jgi:hypothetical protein